MTEHKYHVVDDAEVAELLKRVTARSESAVNAATARDPRVCARCVRLGIVIGQIMSAEIMIEDGVDLPDVHAALQSLYTVRDVYLDHQSKLPVVQ